MTLSVPEIEPSCAVIVEDPFATLSTRPVAFTVAALVFAELHVDSDVTFCWLPSLNVPVAVSCSVEPRMIAGLGGVTAIETSTGAVTVNNVEPLIEPEVAVMVDCP